MPTDQAPSDMNEPTGPEGANPTGTSLVPDAPAAGEQLRPAKSTSPVVRGSRWGDYDTHELLQLITDLEDERRWARLREGFWLAILFHLALLSAVTWIPKYVFKAPLVVDRSAIKQHNDFRYRDTRLALPPKPVSKQLPRRPLIDKEAREAVKREKPPAAESAPKPA